MELTTPIAEQNIIMKNSEVKYQLLQGATEEQSQLSTSLQDTESGLTRRGIPSATVTITGPNLLQRILFCPPRWTLFLVIATFVALYVFTTLEVSFVDNRRSWTPTWANTFGQQQPSESGESLSHKYDQVFEQKLLKPFGDLMNELNVSVAKLSGSKSQVRPFTLPGRIQLNNSQTYHLVEQESNLAATYWERWNSYNFGRDGIEKDGVQYCRKVRMISPHKVRQNNIYWQIVDMLPPSEFAKKKKQRTMQKLYLYNAYYDKRLKNRHAVKVIATTDQQVLVEKRRWW